MKVYILDASALINGFYIKDCLNIMTSSTVSEIKDINTEILLSSGDLTRLSDTDKDIVALSLKHKYAGDEVITVTDDYSIQNVLKLLNIKYKTVFTKGIKDTISWKKICKGCRKEFSADTSFEECDICGSPIIRKRVNAHTNY